jgi:hypothetical protein
VLRENGASFIGRVHPRGQVREETRAVTEFILYGKRRQSTEAAASLVGLVEAFGKQASLERECVQRRERGRHLAGARAGEVGKCEAVHAGTGVGHGTEAVGGSGGVVVAARGLKGLRAEFKAARAVWVVCHGRGKMGYALSKDGSWKPSMRWLGNDAASSCAQ